LWSLEEQNPVLASITQDGLLTAIGNGIVTALAKANDGSGVSGSLKVTISNQNLPTTISPTDVEPVEILFTHSFINIRIKEMKNLQHIFIYNILGNLIMNINTPEKDNIMDKSLFIPGVYIVVFSGTAEYKTYKISIP
jgi:hypothetical protein